ncbi:hypothetical protein PsgB076_04686 [Pseudomonas savastanoi pv. glycinea str. B076]|nr:hypothetical protein PsgB076_04686 [Pseudomonas savastanoi pv. glycinea str. B076]
MVFGNQDGGSTAFNAGNYGVTKPGQHVLADAFSREEINGTLTKRCLLQCNAHRFVRGRLRGIAENIHSRLEQRDARADL